MKIYNGENMLLGRLASRVAKDALLGEEVKVINCDKVIVSGKKVQVFATILNFFKKHLVIRKILVLKKTVRLKIHDRNFNF